ncbi:UNVERIFIED_CONTAM: hypothetical protein GTU68_061691 [Idotea baltica]|nr:hypothetical protein [Idotea baltica]
MGGLLSGGAVLIGAFGAHGLSDILDDKAMGWIQTGARYQTSQALALIACGCLPPSKVISIASSFFIAGILLFSGSLYAMALTGVTTLGIVTPIGGGCLLCAWGLFCYAVCRQQIVRNDLAQS